MARDVIHEVYEPRKERIEMESLLKSLRTQSKTNLERFPLIKEPNPLPAVILDHQLLRYIHRNAISNACKYGKVGGVVKTVVRYDKQTKRFEMDVINLPGGKHAFLLQLDSNAVEEVFSPGTRLHPGLGEDAPSDDALKKHSSGDGAWIMQKCAHILKGKCFIKFESHRTVFSLRIQDVPFFSKKQQHLLRTYSRFQIPNNTWGIALDDSKIQRKLLDRFLSMVGVGASRRVVLGKDTEEVLGFNSFLQNLVMTNPDDRFLVIVDENLDIVDNGCHERTVSGSVFVKRLREDLDPRDEARLLTLVRSANDSKEDIDLYNQRAHGFLPKAPIKRDKVSEMLQPLWAQRFSEDAAINGIVTAEGDTEDDSDEYIPLRDDMTKAIDFIDALMLHDEDEESAIATRWPVIREKIHSLRGDLMTMTSNARVKTTLEAMEKLGGEAVPFELVERWKLIRSLIVSMI